MEAVVDTSFLIALLIEDDEYHKKAVEMFENLKKIYIPSIVIHELSLVCQKQEAR